MVCFRITCIQYCWVLHDSSRNYCCRLHRKIVMRGLPIKKIVIDRWLQSITPPKCITRSPRSIDERETWQASEWRSWVPWYFLLCIQGLIPIKYIRHVALLVSAMNILLQTSVTPIKLQTAHTLLVKYEGLFQQYFGKKSMTYNIHLLLHLSKTSKTGVHYGQLTVFLLKMQIVWY